MTNASRYLHCIYADDVRQENNGKVFIVGMYMGGMHVSELPAHVPHLFVVATLHSPRGDEIRSLKLTLSYGGKELASVDAPAEAVAKFQQFDDPESTAVMIQIVINVAPFAFETEGRLKAVATINGTEIVAGNPLKISVQKGLRTSSQSPTP